MFVGSDVDGLATFGDDLFHGCNSDAGNSVCWCASDSRDCLVFLRRGVVSGTVWSFLGTLELVSGSLSPSHFGGGTESEGVARSFLWSSELPCMIGGGGLVYPLAGVAVGTIAVVVGTGLGVGVVASGGGGGAASRLSDCSGGSSWSGSWASVVSSAVGSVSPPPG